MRPHKSILYVMDRSRAARFDTGSSSLSAALHLVHTEGTIRRSELTNQLGLSRGAVGTLVEELRTQRLVAVETSPVPAGDTGRPSHVVSPHPEGPVAAAVALRSQTYRVALVGLGGDLIAPTVHPLPEPTTPDRVLEAVAREVADAVRSTSRPCVGVGMAVPSAVSRDDQHALAALYLRWPPAVPVRERMVELLLSVPAAGPVSVGNDANLAALAEHRHGAGAGATDMLFLTTGQRGVGGALMVAGRLHTGSAGYALEVGHLTVDPAGRPCHCGSRGCLDVEADPVALVTAAHRRPQGDLEAAGRDVLADAATDPSARAAAEQVADRLGVGLAGLVNLFNPDRIVLGGLHADLLAAVPGRVVAVVRDRSFLDAASEVAIGPGRLGDDAVLLGAGELALQPVLDDPRRWAAGRDA
jgi:predicted NBD/HSP70 family sugar kinase